MKLSKPQKSNVYEAYWKFAVDRNEVFTRRLTDPFGPWTNDPVIRDNRFTNIFRASDRVSQYLISLQYSKDHDAQEVFFKTLLFKIFNKIETYNYLDKELGNISSRNFSVNDYDNLLTARMANKQTIYSAAYIMPSAGNVFGFKYKHTNHLALLAKMMDDRVFDKITESKSLEGVYNILLSYPSFGSFLAFQYTIDLNYSSITNFSEMDFVVAGPGAKNGILKCFSTLGDYSYEDIIKMMADNQENECKRLGLPLPTLWGRTLQLIDCQNLFCEVDKYLRVTNPDLNAASGKSRIKQKYLLAKAPVALFFPPKWNLNDKLDKTCQTRANAGIFL
ncbi:nucleotide kinase domain-containing protein [Fibrella arboris]|uniref:nucleotide kinase domain-containing protein n=1 Tax=Fibrella arboris TaxID=3242486 RepID=UPI0035219C35